jgi:type VI secretion system secreted protein Hcp
VERNHYTVKLTNANIASIKSVLPNVRDPAQVKFAEYEEIALTYQKIEWTWTDGGVKFMDRWDTSSR